MYDIFWEIEFNVLKTDSFFLSQNCIGAAMSPSFLLPYLTPQSENYLVGTLIIDHIFDRWFIGQQRRIKVAL